MRRWLWPGVIAVCAHVALAVLPLGSATKADAKTPTVTVRLRAFAVPSVAVPSVAVASVAVPSALAPPVPPVPTPTSAAKVDAPPDVAPPVPTPTNAAKVDKVDDTSVNNAKDNVAATKVVNRQPVVATTTPAPDAASTKPTIIEHADEDDTAAVEVVEPNAVGTAPTPLANDLKPPPAPTAQFDVDRFAATVRTMAEKQKRYPPRARRLKQTGVAVVVVVIASQRSATAALERSSRSRLLDIEAVRMVNIALARLGRSVLPTRPRGKPLRISIPISFHLD